MAPTGQKFDSIDLNADLSSTSASAQGLQLGAVDEPPSEAPWASRVSDQYVIKNSTFDREKGAGYGTMPNDSSFGSRVYQSPVRSGWLPFGQFEPHQSETSYPSINSAQNLPGNFRSGASPEIAKPDTHSHLIDRLASGRFFSTGAHFSPFYDRFRLDDGNFDDVRDPLPLDYGWGQESSSTSFSGRFQPNEPALRRRFEPMQGSLTLGGSQETSPMGQLSSHRPQNPEDSCARGVPPPQNSRFNGVGQTSCTPDMAFRGNTSAESSFWRAGTAHPEQESMDRSMTLIERSRQLRLQNFGSMPPLRGPYGIQHGPALISELRPNGMPTIFQPPHAHPINSSNIGVPRFPELFPGHGFRSVLLEDFKNNSIAKGGRRYELRDIFDHIVEFSGDQNGSRFIQDKMITASSDEKNRVFNEILPNALQLMMDVFGNYVIQRFFERGDQNQKRTLVSKMQGHMLALSTHVYGCRAVQSALHFVLVDQQVALVKELAPNNNVLKCVKDQNGNHVIQAAIEHVPSEQIPFVIDSFLGQVRQLATHAYGCRVVQRLLKYWSEPARTSILREVQACTSTLISDQYGNYVIQYMLENEGYESRLKIINVVQANLVAYAKQKFASNVVERCFSCGTEEQRREMMQKLCQKDERGESPLTYMIKDAYGNYVIQTLLDTLEDSNYTTFVSILGPEIARAKRFVPNKQAENVAKKMHRLDKHFEYDHAYKNQKMHMFQPGNHMISTTLPTPPSTADGIRTPLSGCFLAGPDERRSEAPTSSQAFRHPQNGYTVASL